MNYIGLIFTIVFATCIIVALIQCYQCEKQHAIEYNAKRPENIPIELRAYKDTFGITDKEFISALPYCLEYKEKNKEYWNSIRMFQETNPLDKNDKNTLSRIAIKDKEDLEKWKSRLKTLKDIQDFKNKQEVVMKLWEEKETNKNCIY